MIYRDAVVSGDLDRVKNLPRRAFSEQEKALLTAELTRILRVPGGTWTLNPVQALALHDFVMQRGGVGFVGVGGGKTIISMVLPMLLGSKRPLLIIPAALRGKTEKDRNDIAKHFPVARHMRVCSYEELGQVKAKDLLALARPDLIILDEAHRAKNRKAGCTRRIERYSEQNPECIFVAMSGTLMKKSILDMAHLCKWALRDGAPLPIRREDASEWAQALDFRDWVSVGPGRLLELNPEPLGANNKTEHARRGFQSRLVATPGIIVYDAPDVNASLRLVGLEYAVNIKTLDNFERLRLEAEAPTGWALSTGIEKWALARQLALGFHQEWVIPGPRPWLEARKNWAKFVRTVLSRSKTWDTEMHVANAVDAGDLPVLYQSSGKELLRIWREIRDTFVPNARDHWHDDSALDVCEKWGKEGPGLIFTDHTFFAQALAKKTGWDYYGAQGLNARKESIVNVSGKDTVIASRKANSTGQNLQMFSRALMTACPGGADEMEQGLGRLHREGQKADEVEYTFMLGCMEHVLSFEKALGEATVINQLTGAKHKITYADRVSIPDSSSLEFRDSWQWRKDEQETKDVASPKTAWYDTEAQ